jgi:hypothetical protein
VRDDNLTALAFIRCFRIELSKPFDEFLTCPTLSVGYPTNKVRPPSTGCRLIHLPAYLPSIESGQGFRIRLGIPSSGLASRASDKGLCGTSIEPTVSTQLNCERNERFDARSGNGIGIEPSMMASSCEGKDGSAGSGNGGIKAAPGKLGSAGSGGDGIAASGDTSGRVDGGGSCGEREVGFVRP